MKKHEMTVMISMGRWVTLGMVVRSHIRVSTVYRGYNQDLDQTEIR